MREELKAYARRLTRDDDRAEDLVQESMLKLWDMHLSLGAEDNIKALAITIIRNKYNDQWRHQRLENGKALASEQEGDNGLAPEIKDEVELIKYIVEHLPTLQREIFRMKEIDGYESQEIIQITGCSAESLRQNLSRARRKIREEFIRLTTIKKTK